ncbi:bifunctional diaminohydroxyphosphoribosylaminopyrimidine deaminase/5-amino-6-(5-phosphoribosylamino)uracil reductase RibD [Cellulomonas cellasea]|uniref:bifunctional diaminohydroxyphosphoribosylaminopyrimidine deaminase/5-amino-6-(5-phosphoribosylamino)uracil reductase RibD n=1 Tax=Cellulomonas cellasea TaxID=43670 RepID=UPI0025A47B21|nr:bifunctional diaminohydroxyphosphoribosylaminopyrimidine deaminase/5-amino-6-(5-phosphoribosylamino)uracil reductase RibD [Cellulomonas cellasea]MDM8083890.1 bifunctional diaminohydroxyphosphoribosylaminopyrimidine deaminase/5-amino-6-(5-phosphoribosylamino)uracil reductase RibD [Cellulomonas cellasea]
MDQADEPLRRAMARALELAARGPAHGPNPRVGCVLLSADGRTLGEGWHRGAGTSHAEVAALDDARERGHDVHGATAVVTLEPCDHTGRTGPCSQALIAAGVARVAIAVEDPNPVASGGAARLRAAGVDVLTGIAAVAGREVLGHWWHAVERGRPFVTLKLATSLDGRVSAADGSSRWITSQASRQDAHALRAQVDAIAVGSGTVQVDDPALTARDADGALAAHQPLRVVVGRRPVPANGRLRGEGGELVHVPTHDPHEVLAVLHEREVRHLLVEGGPTLAAAFLRAGVVDEVRAYVAPVLLGAGLPAVADLGIASIDGALRLEPSEVRRLGPDVLVISRLGAPHTSHPNGPSDPAHLIRTASEES